MPARIQKAAETMSARERVARTFAFETTDRVTIGYDYNPGINARLLQAFGLGQDQQETLLQLLGVDYREIAPPYTGPELYHAPKDRRVHPLEGAVMRWVDNPTGGYWDFCDFPLAMAEDEAFAAFSVPNPDHFDYAQARAQALAYGGKAALFAGNPGIPDIINSNSRIMGMEDFLCHLQLHNEAAWDFVQRRAAFQLGMLERLLDACRGLIDFVWLGEDLGMQRGALISLDSYRRMLKPIHARFAALARAYGVPCIMHSCGSSSWAFEDLIEIGIQGVDTLQPEAADMAPASLAQRFGGRLNFRGCISTAGPLVSGTPQQVRQLCRDTLRIMMPCRGYHFAPTHQIQDNTPVDNVLAMYQAAHDFGRYEGQEAMA